MENPVELERRLAAFKPADAALIFLSGFSANAGLSPRSSARTK